MSEPKPQPAKIKQTLTPPEGQRLYAVLDGASVPGLLDKLKEHPKQHFALIAGQLEPDLAAAAPYVVELAAGGKLTGWLVEEGWGKHWGLFAFCKRENPWRSATTSACCSRSAIRKARRCSSASTTRE